MKTVKTIGRKLMELFLVGPAELADNEENLFDLCDGVPFDPHGGHRFDFYGAHLFEFYEF